MQVNIPEGLTHQTPEYLASWLAKNGFNCVRLTYSIDLALNPNYSVQTSFKNAASSTGVSAVANLYNTAVAKNSWLSSSTTIGAFGRVISALNSQGVMVILDNHVSRASWCCGGSDGNGWFKSGNGDANTKYFDVNDWVNGLKAMAQFSKSYPNVVGMSLRNEFRPASGGSAIQQEWATRVKQAATAIYQTNSNLLIMIGGISYALDLSWLYNAPLDRSQFPNRVVWEAHWCKYSTIHCMADVDKWTDSWSYSTTDCNSLKTTVGNSAGYLLTSGKSFTGPLWVSICQ
jgi:endoglucanase